MKSIIAKVRQLVDRYIISETFKFKYALTIYAIGGVHVFLIFLFALFRVYPMVILNVGSVAMYLYCIRVIKYGYDEELIKTFYLTYLEIIIHSFAATLFVGWHFGFAQYIIGLIPFGYYMCVTMINNDKKYLIATMLGFGASVSFIGCRILSAFVGSFYQLSVSPAVEVLIYIFNSICNFFLLFMFTLIFVIDIQITEKKLHNQNIILDNMASTDPMTGLYNRRSMQAFLEHAVASGEPFCLIMCDIDNFKRVNDTYGHDFGDIVIKDIAQIITQEVKDFGHVCRWGGEEILILCNGRLDRSLPIAENIRRNVEKHSFSNRELTIHCTLTLGIATHMENNKVEETIKHADERLYYGKQNGKNRVVSAYDTA